MTPHPVVLLLIKSNITATAQPMSRTPSSTATARPTLQASFQPPARLIPQQGFRNLLPYSPETPPAYSDSGDGEDDSDESVVELKIQDEAFEEDDEIYLPFSRAPVGDSSMDDDDDDLGTATLTNIRRRRSERIATGDASEAARQERIRDSNTRRHPSEASSTPTMMQGGSSAPVFGNPVPHRNIPPGSGGHGAESSPSMGSSFSDLSGMWDENVPFVRRVPIEQLQRVNLTFEFRC